MPSLTLNDLFRERADRLGLSWVAGAAGAEATLTSEMLADPAAGSVGHMNLVRPFLLQVVGLVEQQYLCGMGETRQVEALEALFDHTLSAILVTDGLTPMPEMIERAEARGTPLFATAKTSKIVVNNLAPYLQRRLGEVTAMHGVLLDVLGVGVLITGDSAIGKSELALELVSRGAGLVADDVVELQQVGPEMLQGSCPDLLRDVLEVRGLGVLNIKSIFGETLVRPRKMLALIVALQEPTGSDESLRLALDSRSVTILGVEIPQVTLVVKAGRSLAVLVEAAVRNHILLTRGIDSTREFIERQHARMNELE